MLGFNVIKWSEKSMEEMKIVLNGQRKLALAQRGER